MVIYIYIYIYVTERHSLILRVGRRLRLSSHKRKYRKKSFSIHTAGVTDGSSSSFGDLRRRFKFSCTECYNLVDVSRANRRSRYAT